jgi:hypothetical protein
MCVYNKYIHHTVIKCNTKYFFYLPNSLWPEGLFSTGLHIWEEREEKKNRDRDEQYLRERDGTSIDYK